MTRARYSRRDFLTQAVVAPVVIAGLSTITKAVSEIIASPDRRIKFHFHPDVAQLRYFITIDNQRAIDWSVLSMTIEGEAITDEPTVQKVDHYSIRETYPTRGAHSIAVKHFHGARFSMRHPATATDFVLELRVFNDGAAFRFVVPRNGRQTPDEATSFTIPFGSTVWFHDFQSHYEGIHKKRLIGEVEDGEWAAPPLTAKLPKGRGYVAITEAAVVNYAGMGLRADGQRAFRTVLGHALPISHPFDLRYGREEARRLAQPATIDGPIMTPWRVILVAPDLNKLVNSDIVNDLSPPPDQTIFPAGVKTDWVKPGRAVWRYLDGGENTFDGMKEFSRLAAQLGFEYNVIEGFWQRWTEEQMRELVVYSNQQNVKLWFWKHSRTLRTPQAREDFFTLLNRVGVVGAKIDFFDHEAKEIIDLYQALLRSAAEHKIMLEFHGANKPLANPAPGLTR